MIENLPNMRAPNLSANDNAGQRNGYVLHMWTGLFPLDDCGRPVLFPTAAEALAHVSRCPSWGRHAVTVYECTVRPNGVGGRPDYLLGAAIANGAKAPARKGRTR